LDDTPVWMTPPEGGSLPMILKSSIAGVGVGMGVGAGVGGAGAVGALPLAPQPASATASDTTGRSRRTGVSIDTSVSDPMKKARCFVTDASALRSTDRPGDL
jgi:hypothetical protein